MDILTTKQAGSCLSLGSYTESVYTELKEFFSDYDTSLNLESIDYERLYSACDIGRRPATQANDALFDLLYDRANPNSIHSLAQAAYNVAMSLSPEIGYDATSYVKLALSNLQKTKNPSTRLLKHRSACDNLLSFWGSIEDCTAPTNVKALIFLGKYVKRIELYARFKKGDRTFSSPFLKFNFYLQNISPEGSAALQPVLSQLAERIKELGYSEQASFVHVLALSCAPAQLRPATDEHFILEGQA
ncbi:MAG: hypothetical protein SOI23_06670 [Atopobiaceae bacterium]|jgi:hypothetical protein|nr:hypothetical protein [Olegusella sp.]MCI1934295.1 hypothetical protein [Atopobiaceae bacterium]